VHDVAADAIGIRIGFDVFSNVPRTFLNLSQACSGIAWQEKRLKEKEISPIRMILAQRHQTRISQSYFVRLGE